MRHLGDIALLSYILDLSTHDSLMWSSIMPDHLFFPSYRRSQASISTVEWQELPLAIFETFNMRCINHFDTQMSINYKTCLIHKCFILFHSWLLFLKMDEYGHVKISWNVATVACTALESLYIKCSLGSKSQSRVTAGCNPPSSDVTSQWCDWYCNRMLSS